jgi:hypothetical protein
MRRKPHSESAFVGRVPQLERLATLLTDPQIRGISLHGPPGVGKSRLAQEAAARSGRRAIGVDLAADDPLEALRSLVSAPSKRVLVLADGEPAWRARARAVADYLAHHAGDATLVTPFGGHPWADAYRVEVPPLSLSESRLLLRHRLRSAGADNSFDLGSTTYDRILDLLDGLPLAVEICAEKLVFLSPEEVARRLREPFRLLRRPAGGARRACLDDAFQGAWAVLAEAERDLLCRALAWPSPVAVAEVEAAVPDHPDFLCGIEALLHGGWLQMDGELRRVRALPLVRRFAGDVLPAGVARGRAAHLAWLTGEAERHAGSLRDRGDEESEAWLCSAEHDLLAAATTAEEAGDADTSARLLVAIDSAFCGAVRPAGLAERWRSLPERDVALRTRVGVLLSRADTGRVEGHVDTATSDAEQAGALAAELGDPALQTRAALTLAQVALAGFRTGAAEAAVLGAKTAAARISDPRQGELALARLHAADAMIARSAQRFDEALRHAELFHAAALSLEHGPMVAYAVELRLGILLDTGDLARAREALEELSAEAENCLSSRPAARLLELGGWIALLEFDFAVAATHYREAIALFAELGDPREYATRAGLACALIGLDRPREATAALGTPGEVLPPPIRVEYELARAAAAAHEWAFAEARARIGVVAEMVPTGLLDQVLPLMNGTIEVEEARAAEAGGASDDARRLWDSARARQLNGKRLWPDLAWLAARWLSHRLERFALARPAPADEPTGELVVDRQGRWLSRPGGALKSLARRRVMSRIAAALIAAGEEGLSVREMFAAGWPGESIRHESARNRVWVTVARMRALGFGSALVHDGNRYHLRNILVEEAELGPAATSAALRAAAP